MKKYIKIREILFKIEFKKFFNASLMLISSYLFEFI